MIPSFCDLLRKHITAEIELLRNNLEAGTSNDAGTRGELRACRRFITVVDELEERARRADME